MKGYPYKPHYQLTADEKREMVESLVQRYREGEIGPITFEAEIKMMGVNASDANDLKLLYRDECAQNRVGQFPGAAPSPPRTGKTGR